MEAFLEVWGPRGSDLVNLEGEDVSVGRAESNDLVLDDGAVSAVHATLARYRGWWCLKDLGSSNGTFVNGEPVISERRLRAGDEIRLGSSRIVFRTRAPSNIAATVGAEAPPEITRRERDVLVALCRPLVSGQPFAHPATVKEIAEQLFVTEAAVKNHLASLYDKFAIHESGESRRLRLANDAVLRQAVTIADLTAS